MTDFNKLGRNLVLTFSLAVAGAGAGNFLKAAGMEITSNNYAVSSVAENKIAHGQQPSIQELQALVAVRDNETRAGQGLALAILGTLGVVGTAKKPKV